MLHRKPSRIYDLCEFKYFCINSIYCINSTIQRHWVLRSSGVVRVYIETICRKAKGVSWCMEPLGRFSRELNGVPREYIESSQKIFRRQTWGRSPKVCLRKILRELSIYSWGTPWVLEEPLEGLHSPREPRELIDRLSLSPPAYLSTYLSRNLGRLESSQWWSLGVSWWILPPRSGNIDRV